MTKIPDIKTMLKSGVHFGHQTAKWYPKMKPYIFTQKDGVHIIDLTKTTEKLEEATGFVEKIAASGGKVLFVGIKQQVQSIVKQAAKECDMPYMAGGWIGGLLTNFSTVIKTVKQYKMLIKKRDAGELDKYTKKEKSQFEKEIDKLEKKVGGIVEMDKFPQAIFLLDMKKSKTALDEAGKRKLPIIAICDTNCNPDLVNYAIPANDDSVKSVELIAKTIGDAVNEGKKQLAKNVVIAK